MSVIQTKRYIHSSLLKSFTIDTSSGVHIVLVNRFFAANSVCNWCHYVKLVHLSCDLALNRVLELWAIAQELLF